MRNSDPCRFAAIVFFGVFFIGSAEAQPQDAEARARAALRQATVQLRELQDQNAALMAKQAEAERDRMALAQQLAADEKELAELRGQVRTGRAAADRATAEVATQKDSLAKLSSDYKDNLAKWQASYNEAANVARTRDEETKRLEATLVQTRGRVQACEAKNTELYKLGIEILDLYDGRSVTAMLGTIEPVTKLKRVQLETVKQDYEDKLRAQQASRTAP